MSSEPSRADAVHPHPPPREVLLSTTIPASTIGFDEIPEGLARLERGGVVGRIVAELD